MNTLFKYILILFYLLIYSCSEPPKGVSPVHPKTSQINPLANVETVPVQVKDGKVEHVTARISKLENWECSNCHDTEKKEWSLEALKDDGSHDDILEKYRHAGPETMDCMTCHTLNDRNKLHLLNGQKISFDKSFQLCSQCHTNKFKDWKNGAHGKRLGFWDGKKVYKNCTDCHDPHFPATAYPKRKPVIDALIVRKSFSHISESDVQEIKSEISKLESSSASPSAIYKKKCSKCHGGSGEGITGKKSRPPINMLATADDKELFDKIANGYKGDLGKMPGFGKKLTDDDIKALVQLIKSFK